MGRAGPNDLGHASLPKSLAIFVLFIISGCAHRIQESQLVFLDSRGLSNCDLILNPGIDLKEKFLAALSKFEIPKEFAKIKWSVYGPLKCGSKVTFVARQKLVVVNGRIPTAIGSDFSVVMNQDESFDVKFGY